MTHCAVVALSLVLGGTVSAAEPHTVYLSSNGWHTDITVTRAEIPKDLIPESGDFPAARYLQFGWGDADYYTTPDPGIGTTLGAAFPGPAVVHVAGLTARPSETFRDVEEVTLTLSEESFARLLAYLHASFDRGDDPRARSSGQGVYTFSRFYPATGEFHLFNTCNTWTARALADTGLAVTPSGVQSADDVMEQLR
jgi:uncharacterized protein (TIGR02117 family)